MQGTPFPMSTHLYNDGSNILVIRHPGDYRLRECTLCYRFRQFTDCFRTIGEYNPIHHTLIRVLYGQGHDLCGLVLRHTCDCGFRRFAQEMGWYHGLELFVGNGFGVVGGGLVHGI